MTHDSRRPKAKLPPSTYPLSNPTWGPETCPCRRPKCSPLRHCFKRRGGRPADSAPASQTEAKSTLKLSLCPFSRKQRKSAETYQQKRKDIKPRKP
ncbi:hypothetical protein TNCV_3662381 [Trichonephila clavipes]|nr:hypothetical protein TNCV_3662381 [Trichonephila clavipes]